MQLLDTSAALWRIAKKTRPLRAKPMVTLLVDRSIMAKFLVDTLEAKEPVSPDAMFCIGESNDAWQQTAKKLLDKYTVTDIDADGWMVCVPKPENSVQFFEVTQAHLDAAAQALGPSEGAYIVGAWGQTIDGIANLQACSVGDFIARNRTDLVDQWVVRRKIWLNSYVELAA